MEFDFGKLNKAVILKIFFPWLLDAIGRTIHKIGNAQKHPVEEYHAEMVMFMIITDGEEYNAPIG